MHVCICICRRSDGVSSDVAAVLLLHMNDEAIRTFSSNIPDVMVDAENRIQ